MRVAAVFALAACGQKNVKSFFGAFNADASRKNCSGMKAERASWLHQLQNYFSALYTRVYSIWDDVIFSAEKNFPIVGNQ